jgi:Glucose-6-phosphate dehydrogenase subunit
VEAALIENATLRDVERELAELRDRATDEGQAPGLRTSVMTHVAWVPEPWVDAATQALGGLEERHPSRTILLFPRPQEERDALDADVDLRCFAAGRGGTSVCFEVVQLTLNGPRAAAPASVVAPLLVTDLPAFLRWRGDLPFDAPELEELTRLADRLVVDSREWRDPDADLVLLPDLFERTVVSDIAWARTEPWRRGVARLWPAVAELDRLEVRAPRAEALLLAGWLGGRLGRDVDLEHEPADELERVAVDGDEVAPHAAAQKSPSDLLSDQLDLFVRDAIYEEAVRSFSRVTT